MITATTAKHSGDIVLKLEDKSQTGNVADSTVSGTDFSGRRVHFIGIGGSGMNGVAQMLIQSHALVSGTDRDLSRATEKLQQMGAEITYQQTAASLPADAEIVVYSAAIKADHPEMVEANRRGLCVLKYAQLLGKIMSTKHGVAIAGTHGKTTTTALSAYALIRAGLDPSFVVGANSAQLSGSAHGGGSSLFVVEACEYDRSFLNLHPRIAAVLNIEEDHLDYYHDIHEIVEAFTGLIRQVDPSGVVIIRADDPRGMMAARSARARVETYGIDTAADWQATHLRRVDGEQTFDVTWQGRSMGNMRLKLAGRHNVGNALVAAAICTHCGASWDAITGAVADFRGADRRSELLGKFNNITFVDDYGHHPTEIRSTLLALREHYSPQRLICVFQPHQHSRTRFLLNDFACSFAHADLTIVPDIYFVRDSELDRQAVNGQMLVDKIRDNGREAKYIPSFPGIVEYLEGQMQPHDLVVSMGAGPVWEITHELVRRFQKLGTRKCSSGTQDLV